MNRLLEVFGYPVDNFSEVAKNHRLSRLCPFHNKSPNCTKDKIVSPLGVCSIMEGDRDAIICPTRFRQDWRILIDAAEFFFAKGTQWTALSEVKIIEKNGKSAGDADYVLVGHDKDGNINDFGSLEVQSVYISGNIREAFEYYIDNSSEDRPVDWDKLSQHLSEEKIKEYRSDYLSSSRKRLVPQMIYKGRIFKSWGKKQAVAIHKTFFETLPKLPRTTNASEADIAWLLYTLEYDQKEAAFKLRHHETVYTPFEPALETIVTPRPDSEENFKKLLKKKLFQKGKKASLKISLSDI